MEMWLKPNRRPLWALLLFFLLLLGGGGVWLVLRLEESMLSVSQIPPMACVLLGILGAGTVLRRLLRPRVGFGSGHVRFFLLPNGSSIDVPLDLVEGAFLGQTPAPLPTPMHRDAEMINLVVRLSQKATDWAKREVDPTKGHWCDGYVTIHGASCEPLSVDVAMRVNKQITEAKKTAKELG